jgi:hypothetical protein
MAKEMTPDQLRDFFEERDFTVHMDEDGAEVETWTEGGVNMLMYLSPFTAEEFIEYVDDFDMDEEIDLHRQAKDYRAAFSIRESLADFTAFHERLQDTAHILKKIIV